MSEAISKDIGPPLDLARAEARLGAMARHLALVCECRGWRPEQVFRAEILELISQIDRAFVDAYGEDYEVFRRGSQIVAAFDGLLSRRAAGGGAK